MAEKMAAASTATTYIATGSAVYNGLSYNEVLLTISVAVAICSFFLNWYYRSQMLKAVESKGEN